MLVSYVTHEHLSKEEATDKARNRGTANETHKVMYQTSHCWVIMALRLVTAVCLFVKYFGKSLLKTVVSL